MSQKTVNTLTIYQILYWLSKTFHPSTYLEVGVREGASLSCVLAAEPEIVGFVSNCLKDGRLHLTADIISRIHDSFTSYNPDIQLYLFDNWCYLGGEGGRSRIEDLLENGFNHDHYRIADGDSQVNVPVMLDKFIVPDHVDLVFIDGDHSEEGAWTDLMNMRGRFNILVLHDLCHPQHRHLETLFKRYARLHGYPYFIAGRKHLGTGVIFNIQ